MGSTHSISDQKYSSLVDHFASFGELLVYGFVRELFNDPYFRFQSIYFSKQITYDHCYDAPIPMMTKSALKSIKSFYGDGDEFDNFKYDFLECRHNESCKNLIYKHGDNFPDKEYIALSVELIKINKRNKEQERTMIITNKGVYHLSCKHGNG